MRYLRLGACLFLIALSMPFHWITYGLRWLAEQTGP